MRTTHVADLELVINGVVVKDEQLINDDKAIKTRSLSGKIYGGTRGCGSDRAGDSRSEQLTHTREHDCAGRNLTPAKHAASGLTTEFKDLTSHLKFILKRYAGCVPHVDISRWHVENVNKFRLRRDKSGALCFLSFHLPKVPRAVYYKRVRLQSNQTKPNHFDEITGNLRDKSSDRRSASWNNNGNYWWSLNLNITTAKYAFLIRGKCIKRRPATACSWCIDASKSWRYLNVGCPTNSSGNPSERKLSGVTKSNWAMEKLSRGRESGSV